MKKTIIFFLALLSYSNSFSKTIEFSGSILQNTVWDYDTIKITGNVTVNSGTVLTITAGTLIKFQGNYKISSVGRLRLLGSIKKNIVFTINDTTGYYSNRPNIGWGGLELKYNWDGGSYGNYNSNDSTIIDYCVFEYSRVGAISIENFSKIRISNSVFRRNYSSSGAGINLKYSNAFINKCSFFENYSYSSGGALYLWAASPKIYNSSFINNSGSQGGAIDITGEGAWLVNNIFYYNTSYNGGALKFHGFYGILANNIICFNNATYGGGAIYGGSGSLLIVNNTICNNNSNYAPGIYVSDDYYFINSIIWGNGNTITSKQQIYLSDPRDNPTVQNCVIEKGDSYNPTLFTKFENVYFADPKFLRKFDILSYNRDSIISSWSIDTTSICINKGINTYYRSVELNLKEDIALNRRVNYSIVDIGAFESQYVDLNLQEIPLSIGWNILSTYHVPSDLDLKAFFQPLIDDGKLKKVMDETGKTIENLATFGGWKNNIGNLNSAKGYKVKVSSPAILSISGPLVQLPFDINLAQGWNIISYPCAIAQDAKALVQQLIDSGKLRKVMDETGKTIENFGAFGGWENGIGNFSPGKGYKVNVTDNCTLTVTASASKSAVLVPEVLASTHFPKVFTGNGTDHFNLHIVELASSGLQAGDEIGIFDGKYCVGAAAIGSAQLVSGTISIPASAAEENAPTVNGFTSGHPVTLQLYRAGQTYPLNPAWVDGSEAFEKNASLFVKVTAGGLPTVPILRAADQLRCYPNPFVDQLTIEISLAEPKNLEVAIYDLTGKLLRRLFKGDSLQTQMLLWDGTNLSGVKMQAGTYILKVNEMVGKIALRK